jgi:Domain of unknown function (DUF5134)
MPVPSWLYYLFGVVVLVVAGYGVMLLALSVTTRRSRGRDVDISHAFMGISMAGMFVPAWAFGPHAFWELTFAVLLVWFAARSIQSMQEWGIHLTHFLIHAVMSFTMLLMYWFPLQASSGGAMASMSMAAMGSRLDPGLSLVLVSVLLSSATFTLASPYKGSSHHGTHVVTTSMSAAVGSKVVGGSDLEFERRSSAPRGVERHIASPWLEDLSHVVMCFAMGFMLILMI